MQRITFPVLLFTSNLHFHLLNPLLRTTEVCDIQHSESAITNDLTTEATGLPQNKPLCL